MSTAKKTYTVKTKGGNIAAEVFGDHSEFLFDMYRHNLNMMYDSYDLTPDSTIMELLRSCGVQNVVRRQLELLDGVDHLGLGLDPDPNPGEHEQQDRLGLERETEAWLESDCMDGGMVLSRPIADLDPDVLFEVIESAQHYYCRVADILQQLIAELSI